MQPDRNHQVAIRSLQRRGTDKLRTGLVGDHVIRPAVHILPEESELRVGRQHRIVIDPGSPAGLHVADAPREPPQIHVEMCHEETKRLVECLGARGKIRTRSEEPVIDILFQMEEPGDFQRVDMGIEQTHRNPGKLHQHAKLGVARISRFGVRDTQGADGEMIPGHERCSRVEADKGFPGDKGIGGEAGIL